MNDFLKIVRERRSANKFIENIKIPREDFNDIFREPYYNKPQLLRDRKYLLYIFIVALFWLPLNWNFLRRGDFSIFTRKHLHWLLCTNDIGGNVNVQSTN